MQALSSRLRYLCTLRTPSVFSATQSSSFHSTAACSDRTNKKWNHEFARGQQQSPKNNIRFVTREKHANTKGALKNLLYNSGAFESAFQHEGRSKKKVDKNSSLNTDLGYDSDSSAPNRRPRTRHFERARSKLKRKLRRGDSCEKDERRRAVFEAAFGNRTHREFNSFDSSSFQSFNFGFDWREDSYSKNDRNKKWETASDIDSDDEVEEGGSHLDRTILGLPPNGPLKMEDVKNAFRVMAFKWHPDKHQGHSQAEAEEKFKLCLNAYKSLSSTISAA